MSPWLVPSGNQSFYGGTTQTLAQEGHGGAGPWGSEEAARVRVGEPRPSPACRAWTPVFPHSLFVDPIIPHSLSRPLAEGKMQGPALQGPKKQLTDEVLGKESLNFKVARIGGGCLQW